MAAPLGARRARGRGVRAEPERRRAAARVPRRQAPRVRARARSARHRFPARRLARRVGRPHAARAVGAANGANPIAIVVPCHRVVNGDGKLGGYGGGLPLKKRLLALERAQPRQGDLL
ncbi:MAG: methylated-DNA--[protein]-cysteine S-methyltransferase [Deltaproteobacteria bacterium]|nr:MAG: methylated-DNA--[protein]-cysteine S-methyltransferase [Deltaproteobacteria bacterium]